jgi:hypothetical protein
MRLKFLKGIGGLTLHELEINALRPLVQLFQALKNMLKQSNVIEADLEFTYD